LDQRRHRPFAIGAVKAVQRGKGLCG
jgi:hypothetical protein